MRASDDAPAPIGTEADIEDLCAGGTPEGLHLEYKVKQDPSSAELGKDDRRNAAEAIAAFANSDGGTLVYGVRSSLGRRVGLVPRGEKPRSPIASDLPVSRWVSGPSDGASCDSVRR